MACSGRVFLSYGNVLLYFIGYSPDTTDSKIRTASACRKVDPLQYTSHLEASCKTLAELQEYESDRLIIHLVMIQNIVVKISNILNEPDGSPRSSTAPIKMYIKVSRSLIFFDQGCPEQECSECDHTDRVLRQQLNLYFRRHCNSNSMLSSKTSQMISSKTVSPAIRSSLCCYLHETQLKLS